MWLQYYKLAPILAMLLNFATVRHVSLPMKQRQSQRESRKQAAGTPCHYC